MTFLRPAYAFFSHIEKSRGHTTLRSNWIPFLSWHNGNQDQWIINIHIWYYNQTIIGGSQVERLEGSEVFHALTRRFARTLVYLEKVILMANTNTRSLHERKWRAPTSKHKTKITGFGWISPVQPSALNSGSFDLVVSSSCKTVVWVEIVHHCNWYKLASTFSPPWWSQSSSLTILHVPCVILL